MKGEGGMKAEGQPADPRNQTFLQKLDVLVDVPHTVEKVRGLVLDLAFAGRLLPTKTAWFRRRAPDECTRFRIAC